MGIQTDQQGLASETSFKPWPTKFERVRRIYLILWVLLLPLLPYSQPIIVIGCHVYFSRSDWPQLSDVLAQIAAMETAQERPPSPPPPAYDDVITVGYQALPRRSSSVVSSIRSHPPADRTLNNTTQQPLQTTAPPTTENHEEPDITIQDDTNSITKLDEDQVYSLSMA